MPKKKPIDPWKLKEFAEYVTNSAISLGAYVNELHFVKSGLNAST